MQWRGNARNSTDLWTAISSLQGKVFTTAKGLPFTIAVRGNELFVSRKDKSITRATMEVAYRRVRVLLSSGEPVDGPKKLGTFGASYLYPLFIALGFIDIPLLLADKCAEMSVEQQKGVNKVSSSNTEYKNTDEDTFSRKIISKTFNIDELGTCISPSHRYNKNKKIKQGEMYMPRGVKGSGKKVAEKALPVSALVVEEKIRKPYPSIDERIALTDQEIERLTKLNAARTELIAQTEAKLAERKAALAKSEEQLEKVKAKKERLLAAKDKPAKEPTPKLTPEERNARRQEALAKAREARKAKKEKYDALVAALAQSGKTVDELLDALKK